MNAHDQANIGGVLTPSNSEAMPTTSFFISFVTAGTIAGILAGDTTNTTIDIPSGALAAGIIHPIAFKRINASGTSAVGIMWWA